MKRTENIKGYRLALELCLAQKMTNEILKSFQSG